MSGCICAGKRGSDERGDDEEEEEVAVLLKRIKAAHPPAEILKVSICSHPLASMP